MYGRYNTILFVKNSVETHRSNILSCPAVLRITLAHVACCICFQVTSFPGATNPRWWVELELHAYLYWINLDQFPFVTLDKEFLPSGFPDWLFY